MDIDVNYFFTQTFMSNQFEILDNKFDKAPAAPVEAANPIDEQTDSEAAMIAKNLKKVSTPDTTIAQ